MTKEYLLRIWALDTSFNIYSGNDEIEFYRALSNFLLHNRYDFEIEQEISDSKTMLTLRKVTQYV